MSSKGKAKSSEIAAKRNRRFIKANLSNVDRRRRKLADRAKNRSQHREDKTGYDALGDPEKTEVIIEPAASGAMVEAFMNYAHKQTEQEVSREQHSTVWTRTPPGVILGYNMAGIGNPTPNDDVITKRSFYLTLGFGVPVFDAQNMKMIKWDIDSIISKYHQKRWYELNPQKKVDDHERALSTTLLNFAEKAQNAVDICLQGMFECEFIKEEAKMKMSAIAGRIHQGKPNAQELIVTEIFDEFTSTANTTTKGTVNPDMLRRAMITARYYDLEHLENGVHIDSSKLAAEAEKQIDEEYKEDAIASLAERMFSLTFVCKVWEEPADIRQEKDAGVKKTKRDRALRNANERHANAKEKALQKLKIDPAWRDRRDYEIEREATKSAERVVWHYLVNEEGWKYKKAAYTDHEGKPLADANSSEDVFEHPVGIDAGAIVRVSYAVDPYSQASGPHYGVRSKLSVRQIFVIDGGQAPRTYLRQEFENLGRYGKAEGTVAVTSASSSTREGFGPQTSASDDDEQGDDTQMVDGSDDGEDEGSEFFDPEEGVIAHDDA